MPHASLEQGTAEAGTPGTTMDDALQRCEAEIARLETENAYLRSSAREFGELAERLNRMLRKHQPEQDAQEPADVPKDGA